MGSQWAVSFRSASAPQEQPEKQDQNKYSEWEHRDPPNLIPAQGAPPYPLQCGTSREPLAQKVNFLSQTLHVCVREHHHVRQ